MVEARTSWSMSSLFVAFVWSSKSLGIRVFFKEQIHIFC
jgi:hypothetical protein